MHSELTRLVLVKGDCSVSGAEIWSSDISTPANLTMGSTSSHRDTESFMYTAKASRAQTESDTLQWKLHPDTPPFTPLATEHVQRTSVDILYRVKKEKCASPDPFAWEPAGQIPAIGGDFTTMLSDAVSTRPDEVWNTSVVSTLAPESQVLMHGSSNYELEMDPSWSVMHANVSKTFSPGHDFDRWPRQTLNITPEQHKVLPSGWQQTSCSASLGQRLPVQAERHRQFFEQHLPRSDYQYPRTTLPSVSQLLNGITISPSTHSNMTTRAARSGIDNETLSYLTYQDAQANTFARNTVQGLEYSAREMNNYSSYTTPTRTPDYPTALPATVAAKPATTTSSYHSRSSLQSNTPGRAKAKTVTKRHAQTSETAARKRPRAA